MYASLFAACGAQVTGIDLSERSLEYARGNARSGGQTIDYRLQDYTLAKLPAKQDIITLIFCDFCVLSPEQRVSLLEYVRGALTPDGSLYLDVYLQPAMDDFIVRDEMVLNLMDGFWSPRDYLGLIQSFVYPDAAVSLERYLIIEEERYWQVDNWLQYFSLQSLTQELFAAGFETQVIGFDLTGRPFAEGGARVGVRAQLIR